MSNLDKIFYLWNVLYDKHQDATSLVTEFFHKDYMQSINGVTMNRDEYLNHVIEQRKTIASIGFTDKKHMIQEDALFMIYDAKGKNVEGNDIAAEIITYVEFKDEKIFKIHGQVHLSKGNLSDIDMR